MHIQNQRSWQVVPALFSPIHRRPPATRLLRLVHRVQDWVRQRRRMRAARAELASMNNHMLADIGLSRSETAHFARLGRHG